MKIEAIFGLFILVGTLAMILAALLFDWRVGLFFAGYVTYRIGKGK